MINDDGSSLLLFMLYQFYLHVVFNDSFNYNFQSLFHRAFPLDSNRIIAANLRSLFYPVYKNGLDGKAIKRKLISTD